MITLKWRGVNDARIGDNRSFLSATTALINEGTDMPATGLNRNMYRTSLPIQTQQIVDTGFTANSTFKSVSKYP